MKKIATLLISFIVSLLPVSANSFLIPSDTTSIQSFISDHRFGEPFLRASLRSFPDTLPLPHSNRLANDDPAYNKRLPLIVPLLEVPAINGLIWSYDKFVAKDSFANISTETVKANFKNGWVWDTDDFPTNYSSHPYAGSMYFNAARANGYTFLESAPFAFGGSLMWELFMENTYPSYNDLINTTLSGIFLGEVLYRLSSSILDDQKTGGARAGREIIAGIIDPVRGLNRLFQGRCSRVANQEVYEKEPLNLSLTGGVHQTTNGGSVDTGGIVYPMLSFNFAYGDPYETRFRKPYDYFHLRTDLSLGNPNNIVNNVIGEGFLFGGNSDSSRKNKMLIGAFQHYDYWNTDSFEIGTVAFGGGIISRMPLFAKGNWQNQAHLSIVPLGASNAKKIIQESSAQNPGFKNYTFSTGGEMSLESVLNWGWGDIGGVVYLYYLHTVVGNPANNLITIFRPRVSVKLFRIVNVGYEYELYSRNNYYPDNHNNFHVQTGEQRIYVLLNFGTF